MTSDSAGSDSRKLSLAHLALLVPWVALVIDAWSPIRDNSFLWHVRAGSLQAAAGSVLTTDPFSFTRHGEPWLTQSWLAELLYATGERASGLGFVPWMLLVTTTVTFACIGLIVYRYSRSVPATAAGLLLSTVLLVSFLVPRPVIFSFALFALVVLSWSSPRLRWALPFLFWVWASVHGSFAIGLGYVGLMLIAEREWRWTPTAVVSGLVTLATAHGLGVIRILFDFLGSRDALALLSEWRRPSPTSVVFLVFLAGIVLILIGLAGRRVRPAYLLVAVPFVAIALTATRAIPPSYLAILPLIALAMGGLTYGSSRRFHLPAVAVFTVAVGALPFFVAGDGDLDTDRFPVAAAAHLEDLRTYHDDRAGGFLIYAETMSTGVYLDDRAELYGDRLAEFVAVRDGETPWQPVFERDGIEQVLLRSDEELIDDLVEAGWTEEYRDDAYVVLR